MRLAYSGLFSWIEKNLTIVAPSRLQAAVAYQQFTLNELKLNRESWHRPDLVSIGAWLTRCWQEVQSNSSDIPSLLSPSQEHLLWKQIIQNETPDLFDANATARMTIDAYRTAVDWQISLEGALWSDGSDGSDAAQFQRWQRRFQDRCRQEHWITGADLRRALPEWIREGLCAAGNFVFLADRSFSPSIIAIVGALGSRARIVSVDYDSSPALSFPGKRFDDKPQQADYAARWARHMVEKKRVQSIGVLVPGLAASRSLISRSFQRVFDPDSSRDLLSPATVGPGYRTLAYNIHSAVPANGLPSIAAALTLLELARPRIPTASAGAILRSSWITGASEERSLRAFADYQLRRLRELDVTLAGIESASLRCPILRKIVAGVRRVVSGKKDMGSFAYWSRFVASLLQAVGWPGDQELSPAEQSAIEVWKNALSRLAALSFVSGPVSFENATAELDQLLASSEANPDLLSPIQIVDASLAGGLRFDAAIAVGLSDDDWPASPSGSPFLPLKLQREQFVPTSTPQGLRAERNRLTNALFQVAPRMALTWTGRLAPVAEKFLDAAAPAPKIWGGQTEWQAFKPALLDEQDDGQAPPFSPSENTRGGTGVIRAQSICPFRAFSEFRLHGNSPDEGCLGLDARERGGNLHRALELVWKHLKTRDKLRATPCDQLEELVASACTEAVTHDQSSSFGKLVAIVEIARLKNLVLEWLAIEAERAQNFTVETVEGEKFFELAGLRLRLRLDRIDRLANGQALLIDYKSGDQKRTKLKTPRPEEPQLLVYAAGMSGEVDGVLFAQLRARDVRPVGFTREKHFKSKTVDVEGKNWENFLDEATTEVELLARQFLSGYAAVDPLKSACDFCSQKPLCRIHEARQLGEAEE
jgi:ATP-dependent helicase/nuclease subunit B